MIGQADACEVQTGNSVILKSMKAPEGQSESPMAHPNHFCFALHVLHHQEAAF